MFGLHCVLAIGLAALANSLSPLGVLGCFVLVHLTLRLAAPITGTWPYVHRVEIGARFLIWFIGDAVRASWHVGRIVLSPRIDIQPALITYPLERPGDRMATVLGCLLTLTPGTLALDYRRDEGCFLILDARPAETVIADIRAIEVRLLAWLDAGIPKKERSTP
ncbi:MAG: cation:proton antiporter [Candidatus Dactylopiibacterium carminicum]|uniref:Cation:proton antiporter n=1 Tax=Candidatus Dactylopiibacterium carminicum TaxID=857335 RepID=A0A272ERX8_9RHOO|nr:Na+/H+ antiporter subunit E [Candidatus Dactylopiibacterium carminicum]KAF7598972.1 cation:proton antiporter [Candidatus Dactylopiibacterium carminicum]PAS92842.1 MAG: cation:proton antiporter [Candidatus Dactylopiibacterium carminicum]PAS96346.1 MAG: cation:proton antiporter [Candidatus Dactylopiibacterium carminicum]PAS98982.1 MAG: hypothetical protein BSR46_10555 [Candidatus Dactylopiibacterium carminicum]